MFPLPVEQDTLRLVALHAIAAFAVVAAKQAMDHAAVGYWHVRNGHSANPRAEMGMVWVLTLTTISAICTITGSLLWALQLALR